LALRREFSAEAVSGLSDRRSGVSSLSLIAHGGGALVACFTLQRVAASVVAHRWSTARVATAPLVLLPGGGGVASCRVRCSCALLCVVVLASACDVKLLLLFI
jgi:hypothetical protein